MKNLRIFKDFFHRFPKKWSLYGIGSKFFWKNINIYHFWSFWWRFHTYKIFLHFFKKIFTIFKKLKKKFFWPFFGQKWDFRSKGPQKRALGMRFLKILFLFLKWLYFCGAMAYSLNQGKFGAYSALKYWDIWVLDISP